MNSHVNIFTSLLNEEADSVICRTNYEVNKTF